jgi:hypothetical protein
LRGRSGKTSVAELGTLTRFIFSHDHYSRASSKPKPAAFLPARNAYTISMQFIDHLPESETWRIGDLVGQPRGKVVLARADLRKSSVLDVGLSVELAPGVHPLHADVGHWPPEKDRQKLIALDLCAKAQLGRRALAS